MEKIQKTPILYSIGCKRIWLSEEFIEYLNSNQEKIKNIKKYEYVGNYMKMKDVIKETNLDDNSSSYYAMGWLDYYYQMKTEMPTWTIVDGTIEDIYKEFKSHGIKLENDIYTKYNKQTKNKTKVITK